MAYKVKFRIIGDKPPFTVTLHEDNITKPAVLTKIVTTSDIIDYLEDTQSYTILPSINYCIKAVDDINNIVNQCEIPYPDIPPIAENVTCSGLVTIGSQLTGLYEYNDVNGDDERGSIYKWYRSDDNKGANKRQIIDADLQVYILTEDDVGKYIQFSVTPKNLNATGDEAFSNYSELIKNNGLPIIIGFEEKESTLSWSMDDNLGGSGGMWHVEYSLDGLEWKQQTRPGSQRKGIVPYGIYKQTIHFRVKRFTEPKTEYSEVFSTYVLQIHNHSLELTRPCNLLQESDLDELKQPKDDKFCVPGYPGKSTSYTIYLKDKFTEIEEGVQLYYEDEEGIVRPATHYNRSTYKPRVVNNIGGGDFASGIDYIKFFSTEEIWNVNPSTGTLLGRNNTICNP